MTATLYFHEGAKRDIEYTTQLQLLEIADAWKAFAFAGPGFYGVRRFGRWLMSNEKQAA